MVDGRLKLPIELVLDWSDIREAHAPMESNASEEKIVCQGSLIEIFED